MFGGTFDPVHIGHLAAAVNVRHSLGLERLLLVVANVPWQKAGLRAISPPGDRLAMVEAAVADVPGLEASTLELGRGGPSYSADTLAELHEARPDARLYLVVGSDVAPQLPSWERIEEVKALSVLVVVKRPGSRPVTPAGWRTEEVEVPELDISSTDLRNRVADGRPLDYLVPPPVIRVIRERGLYSGGADEGQRRPSDSQVTEPHR
ncbi:MAG TPA: nicotinate-nucleotide adenylyltransferase [Acidimicrobiales bacterium]|nr:nicotinate-nucleotide adenylyltransferase [Acidimicrobiales bacterium]